MMACLNVYKAIKARNDFVFKQKKSDADFRKFYPDYYGICHEIEEMRKSA